MKKLFMSLLLVGFMAGCSGSDDGGSDGDGAGDGDSTIVSIEMYTDGNVIQGTN